jgi:hypothetical protein
MHLPILCTTQYSSRPRQVLLAGSLFVQSHIQRYYLSHQRFKVFLFLPQLLKRPRPFFGRVGRQLAPVYGEQFPAYQSQRVTFQQNLREKILH